MADAIGITIGPVFQTLQMAETPAALWYASACFSQLTALLLGEIRRQDPEAVIVSPFYDGSKYKDGVGRYHDRVIYQTEHAEALPDIVARAKDALIEMILTDCSSEGEARGKEKEYLQNYLQIHTVKLEQERLKGQNALEAISPLLDAVERMPRCNPSFLPNPMRRLLTKKGDENDAGNSRIKKSAMIKDVVNSQLLSAPDRLKSIEAVCGKKTDLKKSGYFAVISADGDRMSDHISELSDGQVPLFSEKCFAYTTKAAEEIAAFGGMTIYAGGDDLLFLAPVQSESGETVFGLCKRLSDLFSEIVADEKPFLTASFGIAIRHKHFPLYEALNSAYDALRKAKCLRKEKNSFCIDLRKHSGQSVRLCIAKEGYPIFSKLLEPTLRENSEELVNSIIYVLSSFTASVNTEAADQETKIRNLFLNQYDNVSQEIYRPYVEGLSKQFSELLENPRLILADEKKISEEGAHLKAFEWVLRIGKFYVEKGGQENE